MDQRVFFAMGANVNLPTGKLEYPASINPNYRPNASLIRGGYKHIPSLTYCFRIGYERSITRNGMHGVVGAFGLTDRSHVLKFQDYTLVYQGLTYTRDVDRYEFHEHDLELHLAYRVRSGSLAVRVGAIGLFRTRHVMEIYQLDGACYKIATHHGWKFTLWYPMLQVEYAVRSKDTRQLAVFAAVDRRLAHDDGETKFWDLQLGAQLALIKSAAKRRH